MPWGCAYLSQAACMLLIAVCVSAQNPPAPDTRDAQPQPQTTEPRIPRPNMSDQSALQQTAFSDAVADALLRRLSHGMKGHSLPETLSVFAPALLDSGLDAHIHAAFDYYESFHVYYKIVQVTGERQQEGTIIADFDLESRPRQPDLGARRQHARLRLEVERIPSAHGNPWRIVVMDPERFLFEY